MIDLNLNSKKTKREIYQAVVDGRITPDIQQFFRIELLKMDKRNEDVKKSRNQSKEKNESEKISEKIVELISEKNEPVGLDEMVEFFDFEYSRQKIIGICTTLVKKGELFSQKKKIPKVGERTFYFLPKWAGEDGKYF